MKSKIACVVAAMVMTVPVGRSAAPPSFGPADLAAAGTSCESLSALPLVNGHVTSAVAIGPGAFLPPGSAGRGNAAQPYKGLPAFCRVSATLTPSTDSDIKIE